MLISNSNSKSLIIRKSNKLIEARYKLSVAEQRLILLLASKISPDDKYFKKCQISVSDFAKMFGLESSHSLYEKVQNAADSLIGKTLQLSTDETISEKSTWLSYVRYVKGSGVINLEFHSSLKPYLLQLKNYFIQYDLNYVMNFKSQYCIRLYELLKMDALKAKENKFKKTFEINDLRLILGIKKNDYPFFANFKKRVIDSSVIEINEQTDLHIAEIQYGKTSRKITHVTFMVTICSKNEIHQKQALLSHDSTLPQKIDAEHHPIIEKLIELGFSVELAKTYKNKYGIKKIERNISYTLAKKQEGLVKDLPAYLNNAITVDLGGTWDIKHKKIMETNLQQEKIAADEKRKQELSAKNKKVFETFQALSEQQQEAFRKEFINEKKL